MHEPSTSQWEEGGKVGQGSLINGAHGNRHWIFQNCPPAVN